LEVVYSNDETVKEIETKDKSVMKTVGLILVLLLFLSVIFGGVHLFGLCINYLLYGRRKPTPAKTNAK